MHVDCYCIRIHLSITIIMVSPRSGKDFAVLCQEEEDAVRDTWAVVCKDLKGNGVKWWLVFFKDYPEYQQKFPGFAHVPLDELAENRRLKAHAVTVMNAINGLIDNLDDPELLTELLIKTGQNHARRKLQLSDFTIFQLSFGQFLENELGELYTPTAALGWNKLLIILVDKISEGLNLTVDS